MNMSTMETRGTIPAWGRLGPRRCTRQPRPVELARRSARFAMLVASFVGGIAGCAATRGGLPAPAGPATSLTEESLVEVQRPKLEIVELRELRNAPDAPDAPDAPGVKASQDRPQWVAGTVRNSGRVGVSHLVVKVSELDEQGRKLVTVRASPEVERLAPGESTGFTARLPRNSHGTSYHVEATGDGPPVR